MRQQHAHLHVWTCSPVAGISCMSVSSRYNTQKYFCMHAAVRGTPRDFISVSSLTNAIWIHRGRKWEKEKKKKKKHVSHDISSFCFWHRSIRKKVGNKFSSIMMLSRILYVFFYASRKFLHVENPCRKSVTLVIVHGITLIHI